MKKVMLTISGFLLLAMLQSCSTEDNSAKESPASLARVKSPEEINFETALKTSAKMVLPSTIVDRNELMLNEQHRTAVLVNDATNLLLANGYTQSSLQSQCNGNDLKIVLLALEVYANKNQLTTNN